MTTIYEKQIWCGDCRRNHVIKLCSIGHAERVGEDAFFMQGDYADQRRKHSVWRRLWWQYHTARRYRYRRKQRRVEGNLSRMLSQRQPLLRKAVPMSIGRKVVYPGQGPCPIGAVVKKIMIREISETMRKSGHMTEACLGSALGLHRSGS